MDKYIIAPPAGSTQNSVGAEDRPWHEGHFDSVKLNGGNLGEYLAESTGYGIVSGCEPSISGLTVTVGAGVVHLADGTRKEIAATNITLDAADPTNPRIDLVYIDSTGTVAKITGTAAASPSAPALPSGGISVAQVSVAAGATTGVVTDSRDFALSTNKNVMTVKEGNFEKLVADDVVAPNIKSKYRRPFKLLFFSDVHLCELDWGYGVNPFDRFSKFIKDINNEIRVNNTDMVIGLGDYSLDNWSMSGGGYMNIGVSNTKKFLSVYGSRIAHNVYFGIGNHDSAYSADEWQKMTGMSKQFTIIDNDKDYAVIVLDTYANTQAGAYDTDGTYTPVDVEYLQREIEKCGDKLIFVCAHYFDYANESSAFKNIIKNTANVVCMLQGHTHRSRCINLGSEYGNKYLIETGNYSFSGGNDKLETMWGFREIELTNNGIYTKYVVPAYEVTINGEVISQDYSVQDDMTLSINADYEITASNSVDDDKPLSAYDDFYSFDYAKSAIKRGDNLNDYYTSGVYVCPNVETTITLLNVPYTRGGFKLIVEKVNGYIGTKDGSQGTYQIRQTIIPNVPEYGYFSRLFISNSWWLWQQIGGTVQSDSKIDIIGNAEKYYYTEAQNPLVINFAGVNGHIDAYEAKCFICSSGSVIGIEYFIITKPYTSNGNLTVFKVIDVGTENVNVTASGSQVTISSQYGVRMRIKKITMAD